MRSDFLFLARFATINLVIFLGLFYLVLQDLQTPLSDKQLLPLNNLQQMDVLGIQTSVSQPDLTFELSKHNIPADCWIEYSGKFYDVTTLLALDADLADYCGQDATPELDSKDQSSAIHSIEARRMISQFQVQ